MSELSVLMARCEDGEVHAFSSEEATTAMCGRVKVMVDAGEDETLVCERCACEMVAALGLTPAQTAEFIRQLEEGSK